MQRLDVCIECGESEEQHHRFRAVELPPGCVCDAESWFDYPVPPACNKYIEDNTSGYEECCGNRSPESPDHGLSRICGHSKECHQTEDL